ncbi:MAG: HAMP domain-containing sensor histidine kinase, partial [Leptolyngbyaceae cyanobacterium MO_188.B28]|nr:HAMP domain-containing sensor histidine kinase [Leptolyngbyaceae cyanobacterium MO_188.B28]
AQMLTDVLTLARAEAQKIEFNPKLLNLQQFCFHIVEEIEVSLKFNASIRLTYEGGSGDVYMDENLLHSILINLLSNAVKYSPSGSNIDFEVTRQAKAAVFSIKDRGIGISLADQARLFEAFYRGENVGAIEGSGLGLAVVKRCVDLHGGKITVQSRLGNGTTFIVRIPIVSP